jgi:hypothetical protein
MTAIPTEAAVAAIPMSVLNPEHQHTNRCYWDVFECRWQCPSPDTDRVEQTRSPK